LTSTVDRLVTVSRFQEHCELLLLRFTSAGSVVIISILITQPVNVTDAVHGAALLINELKNSRH
jgi:hypothetical protein